MCPPEPFVIATRAPITSFLPDPVAVVAALSTAVVLLLTDAIKSPGGTLGPYTARPVSASESNEAVILVILVVELKTKSVMERPALGTPNVKAVPGLVVSCPKHTSFGYMHSSEKYPVPSVNVIELLHPGPCLTNWGKLEIGTSLGRLAAISNVGRTGLPFVYLMISVAGRSSPKVL